MGLFKFSSPSSIFREGDVVVVHLPALEVCGQGPTLEEATKDFHSAVKIFFEETKSHKTLDQALEQLGWKKVTVDNQPVWKTQIEIIGSNTEAVEIPA